MEASARTAEPSDAIFDVRVYSSVLSFLTDRLRLDPWKLGVLSFGGYYLLPLLAAALGGAMISPAAAHAQLDPLGLAWLGTWLSSSGDVTMYYAEDVVHLIMSFMILVGSTLLFFALRNLARVVRDLLDAEKLSVTPKEAQKVFADAHALYRARLWRGLLLLISLALAIVIERKTHDPTLSGWWGHAAHGNAGDLFAMAVGAMVFFGGLWLVLLASGLRALSALFARPVRLAPFHPDGCNGFAKLGDYLIILFLLSVMIAATAWLCLSNGYLGVERLAITWIAGAGGILVIPVILIAPLVRCTRRIAAARLERLCGMQAVFERELTRIEKDSAQAVDAVALSERVRQLRDTQDAVVALYPTNVFPFKPRVAGALSATYILQVVLFLREAYTKLVG